MSDLTLDGYIKALPVAKKVIRSALTGREIGS
jgi:hypothetical protein